MTTHRRKTSPDRSRLAPEDALAPRPPPLSDKSAVATSNADANARAASYATARPTSALHGNTNVGAGTSIGRRTREQRRKDRSKSRRRKGAWKKLLWVQQSYPDNYTDEATFLDALQRNPSLRTYEFWPLVADSTVIVQQFCTVIVFACCFHGIIHTRVSPVTVVSWGSAGTVLGWLLWDSWVGHELAQNATVEVAGQPDIGPFPSSRSVSVKDLPAFAAAHEQQGQPHGHQLGRSVSHKDLRGAGGAVYGGVGSSAGNQSARSASHVDLPSLGSYSRPSSQNSTHGLGLHFHQTHSHRGGTGPSKLTPIHEPSPLTHHIDSHNTYPYSPLSTPSQSPIGPAKTSLLHSASTTSLPHFPSPSVTSLPGAMAPYSPPSSMSYTYYPPLGDPSSRLSPRNQQRIATAKSAILIYFALLGLSPILKSLTRSTASDSIWAIAFWLMSLNLISFDYGSGPGATFPASLSTNAALMASTVLASRLPSTTHVFSLTLFSIEVFGLFPVFRRYLRHISWAGHLSLTWGLVMAAGGGTAICISGGGWKAGIVGAVLGSLVTGLAMGVCSWWLIGLQRFKNEIYGPWDPARPIIRRWD